MAIQYQCDKCGATATTLQGWRMVSIQFLYENPPAPGLPGRIVESGAMELIFHSADCRSQWCAAVGVTPPVSPLPSE